MGGVGWGRLGVIIKSNLNRVRLSCCWVGVGLGCDNSGSIELWCSLTYKYNCSYHSCGVTGDLERSRWQRVLLSTRA